MSNWATEDCQRSGLTQSYAARGAKLILSSRKAEELVKLARSLPGDGHTTLVIDLADDGAAQSLLEQAGDIDVLVANAALPGDLIFFGPDGSQSVALFIGNGQMVEATNPAVAVSPVRTNGMAPYLVRIIA